MEKFFIDPFKEKLEVSYKVEKFNLGNENTKPAIKIEWMKEGRKVVKKTLLFENGDLLSEYIDEMSLRHHNAYRELIAFSLENLKDKYKSIHNIIAGKRFVPQPTRVIS